MRVKVTRSNLTVNAVSGSSVIMLGMSMDPDDCGQLAGFAVERTDRTERGEPQWMLGTKAFSATAKIGRVGRAYSTQHHPIQGFAWSDYTAEPGHDYTYRVVALKGPPDALTEHADAEVEISTEAPEGGNHDIYFNRGVAASQAYARQFGNRSPLEVGPEAFNWLSRGLMEAIQQFVGRARDSSYGLRVAAYEFTEPDVLKALHAAVTRGADVRVVYDRRTEKPGDDNAEAIRVAGLTDICTPRQQGQSYISHNKFIVLLHNGAAEAVLTGGTNFSQGGIFGHSNVAHIVEDADVAADYLDYWNLLEPDPPVVSLRKTLSANRTLPQGDPPQGTIAIFSPRLTTDALDYYVKRAGKAKTALFMTFAFGMNSLFQDVYRNSTALLRYATMESETRPMKRGPERDKESEAIQSLRFMPENLFAIGAHLRRNAFDRWLRERLSNLNSHVRYIHNKFMLVDPLSDDPIVVTGSANFSRASCIQNDENMLIIRGNTRVADIYLGEFMRIYSHHAFRGYVASRGRRRALQNLRTDDWWLEYFGPTSRSRQRAYFAQTFDHLE